MYTKAVLIALLLVSGIANAVTMEVVADGGFEDGTPNASWIETSTNFGTPLCDTVTCGFAGSYAGDWWAWFGGIGAYEKGTISQQVTIPVGTAVLSFFLAVPTVANSAQDYLKVVIDSTEVFSLFPGDTPILGYEQRIINIDAFADGGTHTFAFESEIFGSDVTNFFVDDVSISATPVPVPATLILLGLGLAGIGYRRRKQVKAA